jgi:hypothetical protein
LLADFELLLARRDEPCMIIAYREIYTVEIVEVGYIEAALNTSRFGVEFQMLLVVHTLL